MKTIHIMIFFFNFGNIIAVSSSRLVGLIFNSIILLIDYRYVHMMQWLICYVTRHIFKDICISVIFSNQVQVLLWCHILISQTSCGFASLHIYMFPHISVHLCPSLVSHSHTRGHGFNKRPLNFKIYGVASAQVLPFF